MTWIGHLDPYSVAHEFVGQISQRLVNGIAVTRDAAAGSGPIMAQISLPSVKRLTAFDD
jgi:hypothetical protein